MFECYRQSHQVHQIPHSPAYQNVATVGRCRLLDNDHNYVMTVTDKITHCSLLMSSARNLHVAFMWIVAKHGTEFR